jgi:ABC-type multidrug transport system fused ATPase/permease subunit
MSANETTTRKPPDARPRLTTREHIAWLAAYWKPHRRFLIFLFFFTLVSSAVAIAYPLVFRQVIDGIYRSLDKSHPESRQLNRLLGILALIAAGRFVAGFYPSFRAWMNLKLEKDVRERIFTSLLGKDYSFFGKFRTGDLVTRLTDDIAEYPRIAWFGCSGIFRFVDSASKFVFCVAAMLFLDRRMALLAMIPVPVMLAIVYRARHALSATYRRQQEAVSRTNDQIESAFAGIRIVKAFNAETGQERRLAAILEERIGIQLRLAKLAVFLFSMDNIASRIGQVIVLCFGGLLVLQNRLSVGTLYAFYVYLDMLINPMMDLPNLFVTARQAFVSIDREEEILRTPVVVERVGEARLDRPIERIELSQVSFRYREELKPSLSRASLVVRKGERIAVVGPVASGKSTLLRLVAGLLPPQEGTYSINGRPFREWEWPSVRARIGYVPQESLLFSETIAENVSFGRGVDPGWVGRCLEVAQMGPELTAMRDGIETQLGTRGTLVSGGQKQRVAIARALAGRPDVLLLDDCTASLDARNEDLFWSSLEESLPGMTILLVSHRLATIRRADRIIVLVRGRVIDAGTHEELSQRCGVYREFLLTQEKKSHLGGDDPTGSGVEPARSSG